MKENKNPKSEFPFLDIRPLRIRATLISPYERVSRAHQDLLHAREKGDEELIKKAHSFLKTVQVESERISDPYQRSQLRAFLQFWTIVIYEQTGEMPSAQLMPAHSLKRRVKWSRRLFLLLFIAFVTVFLLSSLIPLPDLIFPVEHYWGIMIFGFGILGAIRGFSKELGVTIILLLSLFVLKFGWDQMGSRILAAIQNQASDITVPMVEAIYYSLFIICIAFISYEGFALQFPIRRRRRKRLLDAVSGLLGGLLNGYLIIGTVWDVMAQADYFHPLVSEISDNLTNLHNSIVMYLPVTFLNEFVMLILGIILLLVIVIE